MEGISNRWKRVSGTWRSMPLNFKNLEQRLFEAQPIAKA